MLLFAETTLDEFAQLGDSFSDMLKNISTAVDKAFSVDNSVQTITALDNEAKKLNRTLTSGLAVGSDKLREGIFQAYQNTVKFGGSLTMVTDQISSLSTDMGKMILPSIEATENMVALAKTTGMASKEIGKMEGSFLRLTKSQTKSAEKMAEIAKIARQSGLDASKLLENVNKNLALVDSFAFKGGVDGLTKMSTQAQLLGVEIGDIISEQTMENLLDPEKAIELAQNLSMIGGFSSDLTNFQQILNKGRNDVGGLQDSFIKLAESAFKVNEATGEITIDALQRDRLRASVEAIGGDYKKFIQIGREAAKQTAVSNKLITAGFDAKISPESMNLVKSLAEIGSGGKLELKIPGFETGDLVKTLENNPAALEKALKDYQDKAALTDRQIAEQSLTIEETQQRDIRIIRDSFIKSLDSTERQTIIDNIEKGIDTLASGGKTAGTAGAGIVRTGVNELQTAFDAEKEAYDAIAADRTAIARRKLENKADMDERVKIDVNTGIVQRSQDSFFGEGNKKLMLGKGEMFDFIKEDQAIFAPDLDKKLSLLTETYMNSQSLSDVIPTKLSLKEPEAKTSSIQQIVTKQETSQNITQTVDNNFNITVDLNVKGLTSGPLAEILTRDTEFQRSLKNKVMEIFSQRNLLSKSKTRFES